MMVKPKSYLSPLIVLASCIVLSGCDNGGASAASAAVAPATSTESGPRSIAIARGKIEVQGGLLELAAAQGGTVSKLPAQEGAKVEKGELLLQLDDASAKADALAAEAEVRLARIRKEAYQQRLPSLRQSNANMEEAVRLSAAHARLLEDTRQAIRAAESDAAIAAAEEQVAQSRLAQLQARQAELQIRSPDAGILVRSLAKPGTHVSPATPLFVILPEQPLIVRAEINENYINSIQPGMRATIVPDTDTASSQALPSAKVVRISPVYGTGSLQDDPQRGPVRIVEAILAFDEPPTARIGQNVRVLFHE